MGVVACHMYCFANTMIYFEVRFLYFLLFPGKESTLGFGSVGEGGRGLCHVSLFNAFAQGTYNFLEVN